MRKLRVKQLRDFCRSNPELSGTKKVSGVYAVAYWKRIKKGYLLWVNKGRSCALRSFLCEYVKYENSKPNFNSKGKKRRTHGKRNHFINPPAALRMHVQQ